MYREVYKEMVESGIASKLIEPTRFDKTGNIIDTEEEAFGLKSEYFLLYPEKLLFADEVGKNTSQANDGNVGGEKSLCFAGGQPQQRANMNNAHFTILGFMAATGECKELEPMMVQGLYPFATWEGDELDVEKKYWCGKVTPAQSSMYLQWHYGAMLLCLF